MSYLNDYLKVIPKADADQIRETLNQNQAILEVNRFSEEEFENLILQLAEDEQLATTLVDLGNKVTADPLNQFYSHVLMDLSHLFPEQTNIETAGENYNQIYQGHLEDLKKEVAALERRVEEVEDLRRGEEGLVLRSFAFEPESEMAHKELYTSETAYLYVDRDGTVLEPAAIDRLYHNYFLGLGKTKEVNVLQNEQGLTSAQLEILYESPHTIDNKNENYTLQKAIDGDVHSFWFNVALKPNNQTDETSISPKGRD